MPPRSRADRTPESTSSTTRSAPGEVRRQKPFERDASVVAGLDARAEPGGKLLLRLEEARQEAVGGHVGMAEAEARLVERGRRLLRRVGDDADSVEGGRGVRQRDARLPVGRVAGAGA